MKTYIVPVLCEHFQERMCKISLDDTESYVERFYGCEDFPYKYRCQICEERTLASLNRRREYKGKNMRNAPMVQWDGAVIEVEE